MTPTDYYHYRDRLAQQDPAPSEFSAEQIETDPILQFFHYAHLPAALQASSRPFCDVAFFLVGTLPRNAERTVALRKLLEAKDAAVRANVGIGGVRDDWLSRLKKERDDLKSRHDKLGKFLMEPPADLDLGLLRDQYSVMGHYLEILNQRIENAERQIDELAGVESRTTARQIDEVVEVGGHDIFRDGPPGFDR